MKVNEQSRNEYHKRISSAMDYIQLNIHKNLCLENVAKAAHLSPFHFHKVFKLVVGETVADFIRRIKLERAAGLFFYQKKISITDTAMELGFSSSQNLAKSFKQHFNLTPTAIKTLTSKEELKNLIEQNRKNGNNLSKNGNDTGSDNTYSTVSTPSTLETKTLGAETLKLIISEFEARQVIYKRLIGEYGVGVQEAFAELHKFVTARQMLISEPIYIIWDNPEITPAEKCRTDICITLREAISEVAPYNTQTISAGRYAYIRTIIKQENEYGEAWEQLFSQILDSGYQPEEKPCFKILHDEKSDPQHGVFEISFCAAVKPL